MNLIEIKQSLQNDSNFRNLFPEYRNEINQFLKDTSCPCNADLYRKIANHKDRTKDYKIKEIPDFLQIPDEFKVINVQIDKLEDKLKLIPIGAKVESMARFGDEVTVIIRISR